MVEHTPGPWSWFGNAGSNDIYLATTHSGRRYVMRFKRWGFSGAQPQFQPEGRGLVDASKLLTFQIGNRDVRGVEQAKADSSVYRLDIDGIDCADARLIAAAPDLLATLSGYADQFCEFGASNEGCGKFDEDVCSGCKARAAIAKATGLARTDQETAHVR